MPFTLESIGLEVAVWSVVYYVVFATILRGVFESIFVGSVLFKEVQKRGGALAKNAADDTILMFVLAMHHMTGRKKENSGFVMLAGSILNDSNLWAHGALIENGFELVDIFLMLFDMWPYRGGQMKPEIKVVMVFHHLPGLFLIPPLILGNLHISVHLKTIGAYLLLAGGVTALIGGLIQTRDFKTQMHQAAALQVTACFFLLYARMWVYPIASMEFVNELTDLHASDQLILGVKAGIAALGLFNVTLSLIVVEKTIRYIRRALPGGEKVDLDDGPVSKPVGKYD